MILPDKVLTKMSKADRAKLPGASGKTAAECAEVQIAKSEKELQAQIAGMLRRNGIYVISQPTHKRSNLKIGTPDFVFAVAGSPVAWEIKMPGQKPREEQLEAMRQMSMNGWLCDVIRSYDEALKLFTELSK